MDIIGVGASIAGFFSYYNTLDAGFVYDDRRAILNNQDILPTTPLSNIWHNDFWGTPITSSGSHGSYRPLCVLTFRLNYILGGGFRPFGFHLINVLLHTICTFLVVKLARTFFQNNFPVFVCGFLFSLHPIHTEAVAGIVGRADISACIFYIISFLSYVKHVRFRAVLASNRSCYKYSNVNSKYLVCLSGFEEKSSGYLWFQCTAWLVLCLIASACAMLSKESGLTVLVVCGVYDLITNCRNLKHFFTKFLDVLMQLFKHLHFGAAFFMLIKLLHSVTFFLLWLLRRVKKLEQLTRFDEDIPEVSPFTTAKGSLMDNHRRNSQSKQEVTDGNGLESLQF